jgi:hypothetical protein
MIMPPVEIVMRNLLAQKSHTTIHRVGTLNPISGQECNGVLMILKHGEAYIEIAVY